MGSNSVVLNGLLVGNQPFLLNLDILLPAEFVQLLLSSIRFTIFKFSRRGHCKPSGALGSIHVFPLPL